CAILLLAEDGKLRVDDKIVNYLEGLPGGGRDVTVRQLLNHTSGVRNYQAAPDYSVFQEYQAQDLIKLATNLPVEFPPGERWEYSNTGYVLLGQIIERISKKRYEDYINARLLAPLKMTATRLNNHGLVVPQRASPYGWAR